MKQRNLAGQSVSALGYGAMSFSNFYGPVEEPACHAILDMCRDRGVTHIDTANVYGAGGSETRIGSYLAQNPGARDDFFIATKGSITRNPDGNGNTFRNDPTHLEEALDASLARLGLDCVDLYYIHRRDPEVPVAEVAGFLGQMIQAGKIKSFGFSEIAPTTLRDAHAEHPVAAVQSEYSMQTRSPEMGLNQTCEELGVAMVAFSPVGRGLLTDRPHSRADAETMPFLAPNPRFTEPNLSLNIERLAPFRAYAADIGMSAAGLAVAWTLAKGDHILPIPGTRSTAHFAEIIDGVEQGLTPAQLQEVEMILPIGWCRGERYSAGQWNGPEKYC